ncbi:MAG TPA: TlpA disulfide reductase family protein [Hanamia sp.]|nr:TlpA disulfide reductase family protein [Hanamia sp.]
MKFLIVCLIFLLQFLPGDAQNELHISGKTTAFENGTMIFISVSYPFNTFFSYPKIEDSCTIKDGKFSLLLKKVNSEFFNISVKKKDGKRVTTRVFLEPSATEIIFKDSLLKNKIVNGNKAADDYTSFSTEMQKVKAPHIYSVLWKEYDSTIKINPILSKRIFARIDSILKILAQHETIIGTNWMKNHPLSSLNSFILYSYLKPNLSDDLLKKRFYQLPVDARKNSWGSELQYIISSVITGVKAPLFSQTDTSGKQLSLSDFTGKGKYIFLDFWASWCGPCREENPALRSIYNDFKNKGLIIIGISLDRSKQPWINAIKKDSLPWPQVSDLKFWGNEIAKAYYVRTIPTNNFLLDPNGIIIARNLNMGELRKMLSGIIK